MRKCECCGKEYMARDEWDGFVDISEFCIDCRDNRCDAYPDTCPKVKRQQFHAELMQQIFDNSKEN